MEKTLLAKLEITETGIEVVLNNLEKITGLEIKDLGLIRNGKGKLQVIIVMWRGKDAKSKEA